MCLSDMCLSDRVPSTRLPTRLPDVDAADAFGRAPGEEGEAMGEAMGEATSTIAGASSMVSSSTAVMVSSTAVMVSSTAAMVSSTAVMVSSEAVMVSSSTARVAVAEGDEGGSSAGGAWRATGGRSGSTTEHSARQSGQGASCRWKSCRCASEGMTPLSRERR